MPNVEIKARHSDLNRAMGIAKRLGAKHLGVDHQTDTYFRTNAGRLKLRESSLSGSQLIPYLRSNQAGPKKSEYTLISIQAPQTTKNLFASLLEIDIVVEKERDIFLLENVRIHLDQVKQLGNFLEFEAVYGEKSETAQKREEKKVQGLITTFEIDANALIPFSYRELLLHAQGRTAGP